MDLIKRILDDHERWLRGEGGAKADLHQSNLRYTILRKVNLSYADLYRADIQGADLCGADLREAYLCMTNLFEANLYAANLRGADLSRADLRGADLCEANLYAANLSGADLRGADLRRTNLRGADLSWAKRGNCTLKDLLSSIQRSDGHTFYLWDTEQGWRVDAGCHWFTFEEAEAHWKATRGGTFLGKETMDILRFFRARAKSHP